MQLTNRRLGSDQLSRRVRREAEGSDGDVPALKSVVEESLSCRSAARQTGKAARPETPDFFGFSCVHPRNAPPAFQGYHNNLGKRRELTKVVGAIPAAAVRLP